ncbi:MAG: hypothetical protein RIR09_926 [Pseudomonadota bacterium]
MSIEISPPAAHAKVASSKEHGDTKTKPGSGSAASGQPTKSAGFMAILAAADEPMPAGLTLGDGTDADSALVPPDTGVDSAALVTQALQWIANPMAVPTPTIPESEKGNNAAEGAEFRFGMMAKSSSPPIRTGMLPADAAANSVVLGGQGPASGSAAGSLRKTGKDVKDTAALQASPLANAGNPAVQAGRSDDRAFKFMAQDMVLKPELKGTEPVLQMVATTAKREEHSIYGAAKANASMDAGATWGGTGGAVDGAYVDSATPVADVSALTPEYVAEQVAYWISNDVQNAEMKLQGFGDSPVEVRISMVGNEAHVAFRTDEAQARDALENASAQLKDMLQRDGVILSGVSVGTSGSGGASGQDRQPRQERQKGVAMVAAPTTSEKRVWGSVQTGRALDLFV